MLEIQAALAPPVVYGWTGGLPSPIADNIQTLQRHYVRTQILRALYGWMDGWMNVMGYASVRSAYTQYCGCATHVG